MTGRSRGFFITGTDTEVGKTLVTSALLVALTRAGHPAIGMKPVAAGTQICKGYDSPVNPDAAILRELSEPKLTYEQINPCLLAEPAAPSTAAALEGRQVESGVLLKARDELSANGALILVEGAGGWRVPLAPGLDISGLAQAMQYPVILVVGLRLGCINHALLSAEAIRRDGCDFYGWIGTCVDPQYRHLASTVSELSNGLGQAPLTCLPWLADPGPQTASSFFPKILSKLL